MFLNLHVHLHPKNINIMCDSSRSSVLLHFFLSLALTLSNPMENFEPSAFDNDEFAHLDASNDMLKCVKYIAIKKVEINIPLLNLESSNDDFYSIMCSHLVDVKQMTSSKGVVGASKHMRILKIGASSSFKEGVYFDVFHKTLKNMLSVRTLMRVVGNRKIFL